MLLLDRLNELERGQQKQKSTSRSARERQRLRAALADRALAPPRRTAYLTRLGLELVHVTPYQGVVHGSPPLAQEFEKVHDCAPPV